MLSSVFLSICIFVDIFLWGEIVWLLTPEGVFYVIVSFVIWEYPYLTFNSRHGRENKAEFSDKWQVIAWQDTAGQGRPKTTQLSQMCIDTQDTVTNLISPWN